MARNGRADRNAPLVVGVEARNRRCAEHTENGHVHRNADVHRPRVRCDEEDAAAEKSCEHTKTDLPREDVQMRMILLPHLCAARCDHLHIRRPAHDCEMVAAREVRIRNLREIAVLPTLRPPARADVERNHLVLRRKMCCPEPRRLRLGSGRQPHLEPRIIDLPDDARRTQCRVV